MFQEHLLLRYGNRRRSSATGTIDSFDSDRGLLRVKSVTGSFVIDETLTSSTSGTCTLKKLDVSTASVNVVSVSDTDGEFINERGKLSETTMRIQDSLYYQDFSYVIKVGQSIADGETHLKKQCTQQVFILQVKLILNQELR